MTNQSRLVEETVCCYLILTETTTLYCFYKIDERQFRVVIVTFALHLYRKQNNYIRLSAELVSSWELWQKQYIYEIQQNTWTL